MAKTTERETVGYCRVSTDGQAESGLGLEAQQARVQAFCTAYGYDLARIVVDAGASGGSLNRPGVRQLLADIRAGRVGRIVVAKLDRLTRSMRDLQHLLEVCEQHRVALVSVAETLDTQTAAGRLVLNVMAAVASWEREAIGERTREALAAKRQRGQRTGTVPYGYQLADDRVTLQPNPHEQHALAMVRELRQQGHSLACIARQLNAQGFRTRTGAAWQYQNVQGLVTPAEARKRWREATARKTARTALVA